MNVVREHGLNSALAIPLVMDGTARAAMNLYTQHAGAFTDHDVATAQRYAALIAKAIRIAVRTATHVEAARHRQAAMESRTAIDMAIGIIMAQNRCRQEEAFAILRGASSHRNTKLRDLAEQIVSSIGHAKPTTAFEN